MPQILTAAEVSQIYEQRSLCRCVPPNPSCHFCRSGFSYKFSPTGYAMDSISQPKVDVDESKMCAKLVFAAGTDRDRKGDIMEVGGIDTSNHKKTPVCYLDHGKTCSFPLAKFQDQNGNYTVVLDTKSQLAWGWTYFCQGLEIAEQVFHLICKGFLASGSIGYRPIKAMWLPPDPNRGLPAGLHLLAVDMVEGTWTGMPVNPEATRSLLDNGKVCGKSMAAEIRQVLTPYAATPKAWSPGFTPKGKAMPPREMGDDDTDNDQIQSQDPKVPAAPVDEADKSGSTEKYGSQYLRALHGDLGDMLTHYDKLHMKNENPKVIKHSAKLLDGLHAQAATTGMLHKSEFPGDQPLEHDDYVSKRKPFAVSKPGGDERSDESDADQAASAPKEGKEIEKVTEEEEKDGDKASKKPSPFEKNAKKKDKEEKSLADDLSEDELGSIVAELKIFREEIAKARPAGTVTVAG